MTRPILNKGPANSHYVFWGLPDNPKPPDSVGTQNPILMTPFFVRMHYLDFLSREPEIGEPWSGVLNRCANPFNLDHNHSTAVCDRLIVSQSLLGSPEFRHKGFYAFALYRVAFNRRPAYEEIIPDMRSVSGATPEDVSRKRAALPVNFTFRPEFKGLYDAFSNTAFVNTLFDRYGLGSITMLSDVLRSVLSAATQPCLSLKSSTTDHLRPSTSRRCQESGSCHAAARSSFGVGSQLYLHGPSAFLYHARFLAVGESFCSLVGQ